MDTPAIARSELAADLQISARPKHREGVSAFVRFRGSHVLDVTRTAEVFAYRRPEGARAVTMQHEADRLTLAEQAVEEGVHARRCGLDPHTA
jgi:hypothetical protein